jgi:hypothetical protein
MRKQFLIAVGLVISSAASAQEWKAAIEKWRSCADAAAARFSKSSESALAVARLAALSCSAEKKQATQAVSQTDGAAFADEYIETAERHYIDRLSVKVIEMRLSGTEKR